jgi:hypothetical protein
MPLPREGVEFDAPATFCTGSAAEREAARVGANLLKIFPQAKPTFPRRRSSRGNCLAGSEDLRTPAQASLRAGLS